MNPEPLVVSTDSGVVSTKYRASKSLCTQPHGPIHPAPCCVFVEGTKVRAEDPEGVHVHAYARRGPMFLGSVGVS